MDKAYIIYNRVAHGVMAAFKAMLHWRHPVMVQGEGVVSRLPELLSACKAKHPMLVTDPFLRDALAQVADDVAYFAGKEGLDAHGRSAVIRFEEEI